MNDPMVKAIHGLIDHAANQDRRLELILKYLEQQGMSLQDEKAAADAFDPNYFNRIVD